MSNKQRPPANLGATSIPSSQCLPTTVMGSAAIGLAPFSQEWSSPPWGCIRSQQQEPCTRSGPCDDAHLNATARETRQQWPDPHCTRTPTNHSSANQLAHWGEAESGPNQQPYWGPSDAMQVQVSFTTSPRDSNTRSALRLQLGAASTWRRPGVHGEMSAPTWTPCPGRPASFADVERPNPVPAIPDGEAEQFLAPSPPAPDIAIPNCSSS